MYLLLVSIKYLELGFILVVNIALDSIGFTLIIPLSFISLIPELFPVIWTALSKLLLNVGSRVFPVTLISPLTELIPFFTPVEVEEIQAFPVAPPLFSVTPFPASTGFLTIFGAFIFTAPPSIIEGCPLSYPTSPKVSSLLK